MSKTKLRITTLLLCVSLLLCACSSAGGGDEAVPEEPEQGQTVGQKVEAAPAADDIFSIAYDADAGINPILAKSATNMQFTSLMYDSVYVVDENFEVSSEVIVSAVTEDYEWWIFTVDTSVKFTDGTTLTAEDVAYSIKRAQQSSYYSGRLSCVYGVSALSEDTFAITSSPANSQLPSVLNIPIIKSGSLYDEVPPGSGPYKLSEDGGSLVIFEGNRHASEMPIDTIYLRTYDDAQQKISDFESALLDIVTNDPTGVNNLGYGSSNDKRYYNTTNMHFIGYNMRSNFFSNYGCRYAMNFVIDRSLIVDDYMSGAGVVTTLPLHPVSSLYNDTYAGKFYYDPDKCFSLFEAAGIADHDDDGVLECIVTGIVVEINLKFIVNNDSAVKLRAARKITEDLNSMGIKTTLYELSWDEYTTALLAGDYDMYYGEIRLTPDWDISALFEKDSSLNYAKCSDVTYSELYHSYLASSEAGRYDAYQTACNYVMEMGGITPVCFEKCEVLSRRGVISGVKATQYDLFNKFSEWEINLQ